MADAQVYRLTGSDIEITLHLGSSKLEVKGDLTLDGVFDAEVATDPVLGVRAEAVVLPSSRNMTRITLTVLVPEASWEPSRAPRQGEVTAVAIVTRDFREVMGGAPPVLRAYEVRSLDGTASDYDPAS